MKKTNAAYNQGELNGIAKLTPEDVLYIRSHYQRTGHRTTNGRSLAEMFKVSPTYIKDLVAKRRWAHI